MGEGSRPKMRRGRADTLVAALVAEAVAINADPTMLWSVAKVSVFGSYLTDKPVLGDLDIGLSLVGRGQHVEGAPDFRRLYPPPASIRTDWFGRLVWPETYVRHRLRAVGRNISFHEQSEVDEEGYPHRVLFEALEQACDP